MNVVHACKHAADQECHAKDDGELLQSQDGLLGQAGQDGLLDNRRRHRRHRLLGAAAGGLQRQTLAVSKQSEDSVDAHCSLGGRKF